jgi:hypothetical protein
MADPNRKINLDLPSEDEEENSSSLEEEVVFNPEEITLVKEFEEEFKHRFTEHDKVFTEFCNQKSKPPPIVFPFDSFHHHGRGGHGRGRGRFQGGRGRFQGHQRYNNHQNWNRNRDNQPPYKRSRDDYGDRS